jgi:DNA-directed RNA polymerase subunit M/transcription elongation factor TFIIS
MQKCPNCNNVIPNKLSICTDCGHRLKVSESNIPTKKVAENSKTSSSELENISSKPIELPKAEIPTYHYLFLIASIFFNFGFWFIPLIGVLLSYVALSDLSEQTSKNIEVGNHVLYTIITGGIHFIYILVVIL